jgi:hypothetical protein
VKVVGWNYAAFVGSRGCCVDSFKEAPRAGRARKPLLLQIPRFSRVNGEGIAIFDEVVTGESVLFLELPWQMLRADADMDSGPSTPWEQRPA